MKINEAISGNGQKPTVYPLTKVGDHSQVDIAADQLISEFPVVHMFGLDCCDLVAAQVLIHPSVNRSCPKPPFD